MKKKKLNDLICGSQINLVQTTLIRIRSQKLSFYNTVEDSELNEWYSKISRFLEFFGVSFMDYTKSVYGYGY